jgi:hypothetical protein
MKNDHIFSRQGLDAMGIAPGTPSFHLHRGLDVPSQCSQQGQTGVGAPSPADTIDPDARDDKSDRQFRDWSAGHGDEKGGRTGKAAD